MKDVFIRTYLNIINQGINHGPADNDLIVSIVKEIKGQDYKFPQFMLDELLWDHFVTEAWNDYVEAKESGEDSNWYLESLKDTVEQWLDNWEDDYKQENKDQEEIDYNDNEIADENVKEFEAVFKDWKPLGTIELSDEGWEDEERFFTWQNDEYDWVSVSLQKK